MRALYVSLAELLPIVENLSQADRLELMNLLSKQFSEDSSRLLVTRLPGQDKGKIFMADDFDDPLAESVSNSFENSELRM